MYNVNMITASGLSFSYDGKSPVLSEISLEIEARAIYGVLGVSGCGKSTLLKVMAGLLPRAGAGNIKGLIQIDGVPPEVFRRTRGIGFVFQEFSLLPYLTVEGNIQWGVDKARSTGVAGHVVEGAVEEALQQVGLERARHSLPSALSGGMKARTAIGRAIASRPPLLLIDEAISSLDVGWRISLYRQLRALRDVYGLTIVFVSHDLEEAYDLADALVVLNPSGALAGVFAMHADRNLKEQELANVRRALLESHPANIS